MPLSNGKTGGRFTEAARIAAAAARRAKREGPDTFGLPELFVVKMGEHGFSWELRRFGGVLLQRGPEAYPSMDAARADGEIALSALCTSSDLPKFKRQGR